MTRGLLYLETDASRVGLGVLLVREEMTFPRVITPDNSILRPIAFVSKALSSVETHYSNIEREALGILHNFQKC